MEREINRGRGVEQNLGIEKYEEHGGIKNMGRKIGKIMKQKSPNQPCWLTQHKKVDNQNKQSLIENMGAYVGVLTVSSKADPTRCVKSKMKLLSAALKISLIKTKAHNTAHVLY